MQCLPKMCYTCLKSNSNELVDLFSTDIDRVSYVEKLKVCLAKDLQESEFKEICRVCIKHLRTAYQFIEMVNVTQLSLVKFSENISEEVEDDHCYDKRVDDSKDISVELHNLYDNVKQEHFLSAPSAPDDSNCSSDYYLADLVVKSEPEFEIPPENQYKCEKCDLSCITALQYNKHICIPIEVKAKFRKKAIKNEKLDVRLHTCKYCDLTYEKLWELRKHIRRAHELERNLACEFCPKIFKQKVHLTEHVRSHTGETAYECEFCNKPFNRNSSYRRHLKSHEALPGQKTKKTPYLCTICGKNFPFRNSVQRHMRIHFGIKRHECDTCKRKFSQSTHLQVHMRTHTGEKPYICESCGDAFSLNASLQKHKLVHLRKNKKLNHVKDGADKREHKSPGEKVIVDDMVFVKTEDGTYLNMADLDVVFTTEDHDDQ